MAVTSFPDASVIQLLETALVNVRRVSSHGETRDVGLVLWMLIAAGGSVLLCLSPGLSRKDDLALLRILGNSAADGLPSCASWICVALCATSW